MTSRPARRLRSAPWPRWSGRPTRHTPPRPARPDRRPPRRRRIRRAPCRVPAAPPGGPVRCWSGCAAPHRPDHHRGVLGRYSEPLQQPFGVLVTFQVNPSVRQSVSRCEFSQPGGVRRIAGADDPNPDPSWMSSERRNRYARRMRSLSAGSWATRARTHLRAPVQLAFQAPRQAPRLFAPA